MDIRSVRKVLSVFQRWSETVCKGWSRTGRAAADSKEIQWQYRHEVWTEKCAKATFLKGRLEKSTSIELDNSTEIKELEQEEVYKCLGANDRNRILHATIKEKMRK